MSRLRPGAAGAREAGAAWRSRSLKYVAVVAIVAAALAAFVALRPWGRGAPRDESAVQKGPAGAGGPAEHRRQRIVVLPFENLGAPDDAYFAAGVTEEIAVHLHPWGMEEENRPIHVCRGLKTPLKELWPRLKQWN